MGRVVNKNPYLFGPGPVRRMPTGLGARPPLQAFKICAFQAMGVALIGGFAYNFIIGNDTVKKIEKYYDENPVR
eukprot:CAMPEP_0197827046 /NCGR_PEP_ID=MMETSP1437-20131217/3922_1 /TAXON_ID=49252 ORGANISM="Eucampia antarctica, Strain CCMP1452" /NCGR_SAMPLE_ID=MMETSP1437 /ASSEMBLY_ACC=CAM_ASM_001096 /LENGTH=73 /DNA_ID=CAMNT_0043427755 /DNA_START=75 /DNA_END=296 /DNA_ORIENTATION=+